MKKNVFYLFDKQENTISQEQNTLFPSFEDSAKKNYKKALIRNKINDCFGALLYLTKAIEQEKYFTKAYVLKSVVYFKLNQYDNAILYTLKSFLINNYIKEKDNSNDLKYFYKYYNTLELKQRMKLKAYLEYYNNYTKLFNNYTDFANNLIDNKKFKLDSNYCKQNDYDLFLSLVEKNVCQHV
jgi:hypothetical protein